MHRLSLIVVFALLSSPALAGYVMEHEAVIPDPITFKPIKTTVKSWHEGRRFKRESPLRKETVIIDLDRRVVFGVNDATRTYWKLDSKKYRSLAMVALIVMGVQVLPDGNVIVPDGLFKRTGTEGKVAGRAAYQVQVTSLPPTMQTEFWLSKEVGVPISKMVDELRLSLGDPKDAQFQSLFNQWLALEGYPVQTVTTIRTKFGNIITSETLINVEQRALEDAEFTVPRGYVLTEDPLTQAERQRIEALKKSTPPAGIGAPLK